MIYFYEYSPAGEFQPIADPLEYSEGMVQWEAELERNGWRLGRRYGSDVDLFELTIYERIEEQHDGTLLVDMSDATGGLWLCLVPRQSWPRFFRAEVLPVLALLGTQAMSETMDTIAGKMPS